MLALMMAWCLGQFEAAECKAMSEAELVCLYESDGMAGCEGAGGAEGGANTGDLLGQLAERMRAAGYSVECSGRVCEVGP